MNIAAFEKLPILGILRGVKKESIPGIIDAVVKGGLANLEITMNTSAAPDLIKLACQYAPDGLSIGAGTVLSKNDLEDALDAGATFIVMPVLIEEVLQYCVANKIPVFPGALTPQEIYRCWEMGAYMVKVFPVKFFSAEYIKEIKGPLDKIKLLACGGVTPSNMSEYFKKGADAVACGSGLFDPYLINTCQFSKLQKIISKYVNSCRAAQNP